MSKTAFPSSWLKPKYVFLALLTTQRIAAEREGLQNKFTNGTSQRKSECWTEQVSDFYSHCVLAWIECEVCVAKTREFSIYSGLGVENGVGQEQKDVGHVLLGGHALVWACSFDLGCVVL